MWTPCWGCTVEPVTGTAPTAWAFGYVGACHSHLLVMVAFIRPRTGDELNEGVTVRPEIGFIIVRSSPWGEVKILFTPDREDTHRPKNST